MKPAAILLVLLASVAGAMSTDSLCEQAAWLFFNRHLEQHNLDSAYALLARTRTQDPEYERCLYLWSRIHVQQGDMTSDRSQKIALYDRARVIAETLKVVNDRNPDGHMWSAVAQGRIGQTRGVMNSLFMVPGLKKAFNRVLELDSGYAIAYGALGVLYYELPGIVGGNLGKSEEYLRQGLEADPDYTLIRLDLARTLIKRKKRQEAREQLNLLLTTKNPTYPADFELDDRPEAQELLKSIQAR